MTRWWSVRLAIVWLAGVAGVAGAQPVGPHSPFDTIVVAPIVAPLPATRLAPTLTSTILRCPTPYELFGVYDGATLLWASCVDRALRIPRWTAHLLTPGNTAPDVGRPTVEPWFHQPQALDGTPSPLGFGTVIGDRIDRGHLIPRSDFAADLTLAKSTFHVINRAPQAATFNQYGWRCVESLVRAFARDTNRALLVVTGTAGGVASMVDERSGRQLAQPHIFWKLAIDATTGSDVLFYDSNSAHLKRASPRCPGRFREPSSTISASVRGGLSCSTASTSLRARFESWVRDGNTRLSFDELMRSKCRQAALVCPGQVPLKIDLVRSITRDGPVSFRVQEKSKVCSRGCRANATPRDVQLRHGGRRARLSPDTRPLVREAAETCVSGLSDFGRCIDRLEAYLGREGLRPDMARRLTRAGAKQYIGEIRVECRP